MVVVQIRLDYKFSEGSDPGSALGSRLRGALPSDMAVPSNDSGASKAETVHDQELRLSFSQYSAD